MCGNDVAGEPANILRRRLSLRYRLSRSLWFSQCGRYRAILWSVWSTARTRGVGRRMLDVSVDLATGLPKGSNLRSRARSDSGAAEHARAPRGVPHIQSVSCRTLASSFGSFGLELDGVGFMVLAIEDGALLHIDAEAGRAFLRLRFRQTSLTRSLLVSGRGAADCRHGIAVGIAVLDVEQVDELVAFWMANMT